MLDLDAVHGTAVVRYLTRAQQIIEVRRYVAERAVYGGGHRASGLRSTRIEAASGELLSHRIHDAHRSGWDV